MLERGYSPYTYFGAGAASIVLLGLIASPLRAKQIQSYPTATAAPHHNAGDAQLEGLAYPPHSLIPGARDVPTPYGNIRVYEFGPASSKHKVLFLHGISTPCISLIGLAENLAFKKGCRVMLVDLFGRGWSDGPSDLPYDGRLYASQVLMALASSPLAWTGTECGGFALVGYSLGGSLAADFTSWFPEFVNELVLIAPAGLMRDSNVNWQTRLLYSGWLPENWAQAVVKRRLKVTPNVTGKQKARGADPAVRATGRDEGEAAPAAELPANAIIATSRGEIDMESAVNWQMENHPGFMTAFMSSIRHAPVRKQQERWSLIGSRLDEQRSLSQRLNGAKVAGEVDSLIIRQGLNSGKVLVFFGGKDGIVKASEVGPDAERALGADNVVEKIYAEAGHDITVAKGDDIADDIWHHWTGK